MSLGKHRFEKPIAVLDTGFYGPHRVRVMVPVQGEGGASRTGPGPGLSESHQDILFGVNRVFPESEVRSAYKGSGQRFL